MKRSFLRSFRLQLSCEASVDVMAATVRRALSFGSRSKRQPVDSKVADIDVVAAEGEAAGAAKPPAAADEPAAALPASLVVMYMRPMTPPPEWCPFGSASAHQSARLPLLPLAQPPCAPHTLEASCWARASTAVGAASMRTSHPRSVVLGCANSAVLSTTRSTHSERVRMHH